MPWDPIPHEYNRLADLIVGDLAETKHDGKEAVAIIVNSFLPNAWNGPQHEWRLYFVDPASYFVHGIGQWPEAFPLARPPKGWAVDGGHVAIWSVMNSSLLAQTISPLSRAGVYHYVIMNHDIAYEFIAHGCIVQDLGDVNK